ncbi:ribonuclease H-like YkuK family protein [Candidatus Roizmanbacteria bacterium]|nr:ribonuclease H-like YkuK family protein [Candidatus Roizmanbacteria bacterium]
MFYQSPTHGKVDLEKLKTIVSNFMKVDKKAKYEIIVGTDSQKIENNKYDFVSALIIHRVGWGGIYFWKRILQDKKISLKERIYQEATMSLETSENFVNFFKTNGISKYNIQIHVDIGHNGETRDLITEVVGMVRGSGYEVKIKPDSYGASKVADRYT